MFSLIPWIGGFAGAAIAGLGLMLWISESRLDDANETIAGLKQEKTEWISELAECKMADYDNQIAIQECVRVNQENERSLANVRNNTEAARKNSHDRDTKTEQQVAAIRNQDRKNDEDCRDLDEPLPEWFVAGLRRDHPAP